MPTRDLAALRPVAGLSRVAVILAAVWALLMVAMATVAPTAAGEISAALREGASTAGVTGYGLISQAWSLLVLPTYLVTSWWLWRARGNSELIDPPLPQDRPRRHRLWAWLGWLLPVLQLWIPYQVVRDTARASGAGVGTALLRWWWFSWIGGLYCGAIASRLIGGPASPPTLEGVQFVPQLSLVAAVCTVLAMACWIIIVRRITAAQNPR